MSQFGINFTASNISSATESSANPSVTLTPSQFEDAISQLAAQYVWTGQCIYVDRMRGFTINPPSFCLHFSWQHERDLWSCKWIRREHRDGPCRLTATQRKPSHKSLRRDA